MDTRTLSPRRARALCALASVVLLAACSGGDGGGDAAPRRRRTTTTAAAGTTAPPGPTPGGAPLTGMAPPDPAVLARPALVVKVDNAPKARPQAGINQADVVIEEKVEDGVTRFFTIFHSTDAASVGPVRSARSTDIALVGPLNRPLFSYSGANPRFQALVNAAPLVDVGHGRSSGDYRRERGRPAPYNLFTSTALFGRAPADSGPPPPLFPFRPPGQQLRAAGAAPARSIHMEYRGKNITTIVEYAWEAGAAVWRRSTDGRPHVDAGGAQVGPRNVVVQFVDYVDTGARDTSGAAVDEATLVGGGEAWVLSDGQVVRGRWSKPSPEAVTTYTDAGGAAVALTPGQTWVELARPGSATLG